MAGVPITLRESMLEPLRLPRGARVLFQGDSITDAGPGRDEDPNHIHGHSYVFLLAAANGAAHPEEGWSFINRSMSANRLADLATSLQVNAIELNPDLISILVGINEVEDGATAKDFGEIYNRLLRDARVAKRRETHTVRAVRSPCRPTGGVLAGGNRSASDVSSRCEATCASTRCDLRAHADCVRSSAPEGDARVLPLGRNPSHLRWASGPCRRLGSRHQRDKCVEPPCLTLRFA